MQSAALVEIALGRVKRMLASIQALLEAIELSLATVERALPALDRRLEIGGVRLARAEPLFGDRQPGAALGHLGRELPQLRLALVQVCKLPFSLFQPTLLLTDVAQRVRGLGLGDGQPSRPIFELLGKQLDTWLALVDLRCATTRAFLARLEVREPSLGLCEQLFLANLIGFEAGL